ILGATGCLFEPYVMGLQVGQKFRIKNFDSVMHNLHATARINQEVNLALIPMAQTLGRSFARPEISVRVKCDVHPWEFAYLNILPHPFFAVTDAEGSFHLPAGLPAGKYLIAAFHPKAGESVQEVELTDGEAKFLDFNLAVSNAN